MQNKSAYKMIALFLGVSLVLGLTVNSTNAGVAPSALREGLEEVDPAVPSNELTSRTHNVLNNINGSTDLQPLSVTTVSGNVYDAGAEGLGSHGYPLYASIHITATDFDQTIYSDPIDGSYEIELASNVEYTFTTTPVVSGYVPKVETVTPSGAALTHNIAVNIDGEACSVPGYQPHYDFFWDFEQSAAGFTPVGTTSWAWGEFTSGPGKGHSGTKGIATNPSGNHNSGEFGYMLSPVINLTSFGTDPFAIQWWDWKDIGSDRWTWATVDVTTDGGAHWTTVWGRVNNVHDTAYHKQTIILHPAYNVASFQFRFNFYHSSSTTYLGWYVDDIGIVKLPASVVFSNNFDTGNGGFEASGQNFSWAWGVPTSGPGSAHSSPNVWATNLTGFYNNNEESYLTSPVINLSGHTGLLPTLLFYHWMDDDYPMDWGGLEATKDGGVTWNVISEQYTDFDRWTPMQLQLDTSYSVSNFKFRFHFHSDTQWTSRGWYIDDVVVSMAEPVIVATSCRPIPGGAVAGFVYDENTYEPIIGADVSSNAVATKSYALEGDPNSAGFYWLFQPTTSDLEEVGFTAHKNLYSNETVTVSVAQNDITQQDFQLGAGQLTFDPSSFNVEMTMGDVPTTRTLTIGNEGNEDAQFELSKIGEPEGVPWLSENPVSGTVPVDGSVDVILTIDPALLDQPGDYTAALKVSHDTPYSYANIPITLHLAPPANYGEVNGSVTGLEVCDINPAPLGNATVNFKQGGEVKYSTATSTDGHYQYSMPEGFYDIEVLANGFLSQVISNVEVIRQTELTQDFALRLIAPCLSVYPVSLEKSLMTDATGTQVLKIINAGAGDAVVKLMEYYGSRQPESQIGNELTFQNSPQNTLSGIDNVESKPAGQGPISVDTNAPSSLLISESFENKFPPTNWSQIITNASNTWYQTNDDFYEGTHSASVNGDYDHVQNEWLLMPEFTLVDGTLSFYSKGNVDWCRINHNNCDLNVWLVVGEVGGGDDIFIKNVDEDWSSNWKWTLTTIDLEPYLPAEPVRIGFQYVGNQGTDVYLDLVTIDGVETSEVAWLSEDPIVGTVPADSSLSITVTFDAAGLVGGNYSADLSIRPKDAPRIRVPVTLHVEVPANYGTITGTVTGLEACDINPAPLGNATVNFKQGGEIKYTTTTSDDGHYGYSMLAGTYDIEVLAEGFDSKSVSDVILTSGSTITKDFELRLLAPCLSVEPERLEKTLLINTTETQNLTIKNTGSVAADIKLVEDTFSLNSVLISEGFEDCFLIPYEWDTDHRGTSTHVWEVSNPFDSLYDPDLVYEGDCAAYIIFDNSSKTSDEWLFTPVIDSSRVSNLTLSFYAESDTGYPTLTVKVWVTDADGNPLTTEPLWDMIRDESWSDFEYRLVTVDLSEFDGNGPIRIAWQYVGKQGETFALDNVELNGYVDVPWLAEEPKVATVSAGDSLPVTVSFDATELDLGDYFANLIVRPTGAPSLYVPINLHVVGNFKLYLPVVRK